MLKSDPRYAIWPHRKPSQKARTAAKLEEAGLPKGVAEVAAPVAIETAKKASRAVKATVKKVVKAVAAGSPALVASTGVTAAQGLGIAAAAGIAAYTLTTAVLNAGRTIDARRAAVADAYRNARRDLTAKLGRAPTAEELKPLTTRYRELDAIAQSGFTLTRNL